MKTEPTKNQIALAKIVRENGLRRATRIIPAHIEKRLLKTGALHPDWRTPDANGLGPTATYGEGADDEVPSAEVDAANKYFFRDAPQDPLRGSTPGRGVKHEKSKPRPDVADLKPHPPKKDLAKSGNGR